MYHMLIPLSLLSVIDNHWLLCYRLLELVEHLSNQAKEAVMCAPHPKILVTVESQTDPLLEVPPEVQCRRPGYHDRTRKVQEAHSGMHSLLEQNHLLEKAPGDRKEIAMRHGKDSLGAESNAASRTPPGTHLALLGRPGHNTPSSQLDKKESSKRFQVPRANNKEPHVRMGCGQSALQNGDRTNEHIIVSPKHCPKAMAPHDKDGKSRYGNEIGHNTCTRGRWQELSLEVSCPFRPHKKDKPTRNRRSTQTLTSSGRGRREIRRVYARVPKVSRQQRGSWGSLQKSRAKKMGAIQRSSTVKRLMKSSKEKQIAPKDIPKVNQKNPKLEEASCLNAVQINGGILSIFAEGSDCDTSCQVSDTQVNRDVQDRLLMHQQKKARQAGLQCTQ